MTDRNTFRPQKKIGQIFVGIPGEGNFWVEARGDPHALDPALKAARDAFWKAYERMKGKAKK